MTYDIHQNYCLHCKTSHPLSPIFWVMRGKTYTNVCKKLAAAHKRISEDKLKRERESKERQEMELRRLAGSTRWGV